MHPCRSDSIHLCGDVFFTLILTFRCCRGYPLKANITEDRVMNVIQKEKIRRLRYEGASYSKIAHCLGLSENTVKSYCKRNQLGGVAAASLPNPDRTVCRNCGSSIVQISGQKKRVFCSGRCRVIWWNSHPEMVSRKAIYNFICAHCSAAFESYGDKKRKYCSHACYVAKRFCKKETAGAL